MIKPFTTDGCSGGMSACWLVIFGKEPPWSGLCVEHDRAYWRGGTAEERRRADRLLMAGVTLHGYPVLAFLMWCAVRVGGHPMMPFSWRWAYGYSWPQRYVKRKA